MTQWLKLLHSIATFSIQNFGHSKQMHGRVYGMYVSQVVVVIQHSIILSSTYLVAVDWQKVQWT